MTNIIVDFAVNWTCIIMLTIRFLYCVFKKKKLFDGLDEGREDIVVKIIGGAVLFLIIFGGIIPQMMDIPNIIHKNFYTISGEALSTSSKIHVQVRVQDEETGEIVKVLFWNKGGVDKGDHVVVQYLPHSKEGVLIELNGIPENDMIDREGASDNGMESH